MLIILQDGEALRARDERKPGHFWSDREIVEDFLPKIGIYAFSVYMLLSFHAASNTGQSWPSIASMANRLAISEPTVRSALKTLEDNRLVHIARDSRKSKSGKNIPQSHIYTLLAVPKKTGVVNQVDPNKSHKNKNQLTKDSLSPVEKIQATASVETEKLNAILEEVQKEQAQQINTLLDEFEKQPITPEEDKILRELGAPSKALELPKESSPKEKVSPPLPKGCEPRYVSRQLDQESWTHVEHLVGANVKTPTPVCKRCGEKLSDGIITQTPVPVQGRTYTRCLPADKKPKAPAINKPLLDAIAEHIEKIDPTMANGYTGVLAGRAGDVWKRKLGFTTLTAENYASIARSIPRFVEWFAKECPGCNIRDKDKFESRYTQFVGSNGVAPPKPVPRRPGEVDTNDWVSIPHPDPDKAKLGITKSVHKSELEHDGTNPTK